VIRHLLDVRPDVLIIRAGDSTFVDDVYYYHFAEGIGIRSIVWESHLSCGYAERIMKEFGIQRLLSGDPERIVFEAIASDSGGHFHGAPFDIAALPAARLDLLPMKHYRYDGRPAWFIEQSRGCGWGKCTFCVRSRHGENLLSYRSLSVVEQELDAAQNYGIRHIFFWGDDINSDDNRLMQVCEIMGKRKFTWECWMRVENTSTELLRRMKQSGCERITFGVESGDQEVLDQLSKGTTIRQISDAFRSCRHVGMQAIASIFIGSPYDTDTSLRRTFSMIRKLRPALLLVGCYRPFLGTKLFDITAEQKLIRRDPYRAAIDGSYFGGEPMTDSPSLSAAELARWYGRFSRMATFFSLRTYLVQPSRWPYAFTQFILKLIRERHHD
jgi:radical SAM superfamily enzyme YgiQ (UPF0313 family)